MYVYTWKLYTWNRARTEVSKFGVIRTTMPSMISPYISALLYLHSLRIRGPGLCLRPSNYTRSPHPPPPAVFPEDRDHCTKYAWYHSADAPAAEGGFTPELFLSFSLAHPRYFPDATSFFLFFLFLSSHGCVPPPRPGAELTRKGASDYSPFCCNQNRPGYSSE